MLLYNSESENATVYIGADRVVIETPADAPPSITFVESKRVIVGDQVLVSQMGNLVEALIPTGENQNMTEAVPLLNPETGEPLGSSLTYGEIAAVIYSLYRHIAGKRDAAQ